MKKSTLTQVTLNRRVTFDRRIEFFSFFLKKKNEEKTKKTVCKWANWVWKPWFWLVHRCFNFLKSVKKFLPRTQSLTFPIIQSLCPGSQIDLYFWNRLPDYFASAREAYISRLPVKIYVQLRCYCFVRYWDSWPDTSQGPEMCLSLKHQNLSKTSEKMGYFDRVTVSLHIL